MEAAALGEEALLAGAELLEREFLLLHLGAAGAGGEADGGAEAEEEDRSFPVVERAGKDLGAGEDDGVGREDGEQGGPEGLLYACLLYTSRCV